MRLNNALSAGEFLLCPLRLLQIAKHNDTTVVEGCQGRFVTVYTYWGARADYQSPDSGRHYVRDRAQTFAL